jgi:hypothetical protein
VTVFQSACGSGRPLGRTRPASAQLVTSPVLTHRKVRTNAAAAVTRGEHDDADGHWPHASHHRSLPARGRGADAEGTTVEPFRHVHRDAAARRIRWRQTRGTKVGKIDVFLVRDRAVERPTSIATGVANSGAHAWTIPASLPPGYYRIAIATVKRDGWGAGGRFALRAASPQMQCPAGANSQSACSTCSTAASCEACGPSWVFTSTQCVECPGPQPNSLYPLKVVNDFPANELGITRACVHSGWTAQNPTGYGQVGIGAGECVDGPPWYFPDETYFAVTGTTWDADSCFNIRPLRVLELFEWNGASWEPRCICRSKVTCLDHQGFPVSVSALRRFVSVSDPDEWCCRNSVPYSCDWTF